MQLQGSVRSLAEEQWYRTQKPFNRTLLVRELCTALHSLQIHHQEDVPVTEGLLRIDIALPERKVRHRAWKVYMSVPVSVCSCVDKCVSSRVCVCFCVQALLGQALYKGGKIVAMGSISLEAFFVLHCDYIHSFYASKCIHMLTATIDGTKNNSRLLCIHNSLVWKRL